MIQRVFDGRLGQFKKVATTLTSPAPKKAGFRAFRVIQETAKIIELNRCEHKNTAPALGGRECEDCGEYLGFDPDRDLPKVWPLPSNDDDA